VDKPLEISNSQNGFDNTSVSSLSEPPTNSSKETSTTATAEDANLLKRALPLVDDMSVKKQRRTSKQKHRDDADKKRQNQKEVDAIKMATREIHTMKMMPGMTKVSQIKVVAKVNRHMGTNISSKTVSQMVREGRISVSPLKRGPAGHFPKTQWLSMCTAFATFIKLEQANGKRQSPLIELARKANAMLNSVRGFSKKDNDLARKLKKATADQFEIDQKNHEEACRLMWTTHANLKAWCNQFEHTVIELGFGRLKTDDDDPSIEGSIVFFKGQRRRIVNLDETDGSLDNTNRQRGGRKPMVFYAPDIGGGGSQANKSGYSPTIICGSNAAGEALPPHFQLKTTAKTVSRERFNVGFLLHAQNANGKFGHNEVTSLPCTLGMNDRAGINAEELDKCFHKSMLPLYPDVADVAGSRVTVKVDSGPG